MKTDKKKSNLVLKIIGIIGICLYVLFLVGEEIPLWKDVSFAETSVYLLFLFFLIGIYFIWKNLIISGVTLILWHAIQWAFVYWVWDGGEMTLLFGFPVAIFGIAILIVGIVQNKSK